jgi:hypothetical protein
MVGVLSVALAAVVPATAHATTSPRAVGHGRTTLSKSTGPTAPPFTATGFFRVAQLNGRWYFVTPQGEPFYSSGIDTVSAQGDVDQTTGQCPYCETVAADYPSFSAWETATLARLRSWGFNSLGGYSDYKDLGSQMPYTVQLSMASGDDWFAPSFVTNADAQAQAVAAPLANDPNLIGYFTDSELNWGPPGFPNNQDALTTYLDLPAGSPGLAVAQQYIGDPSGFLTALATRYFSVTSAALKAADPNHLNLGVKAEGQEIQPELLEAAKPYVDVFSVEDYTLQPGFAEAVDKLWPQYLAVDPNLADFEQYFGGPIMIGEYSEIGPSPLTPNTDPYIYSYSPTQALRAAAYAGFIAPLYEDAPWMVGDDWFEWYDQPKGGRPGDGENDDFGVVNVLDQPYTDLVNDMSIMHSITPDRLIQSGPICDSWADGATGVVCTATMPTASYPVTIVDTSLPTATQGKAYDGEVYAGGGTPAYTYSIAQGSLPAGLKLDKQTGEITGTPKKAGTFDFTAQVTGAKHSQPTSQALAITVAPADPVSITTTSLAKATENTSYTKSLKSSGGTAPFTWSVTAGALPPGITLGTNGVFAGQPTAAGTFPFTVTVTDSSLPPATASRALSLVVKAG